MLQFDMQFIEISEMRIEKEVLVKLGKFCKKNVKSKGKLGKTRE